MKNKFLFLSVILFVVFLSTNLLAQDNIQIGKSNSKDNTYYNGALYDYSDPNAFNIKVMIWGYVKFPGQYIIPATNGVNQFLSLAGGPTPDANLDEIKLFRINQNGSQSIIPFNYSDLMSGSSDLSKPLNIPKLQAGDILLVPGSPKWYSKDYLGVIISIISALASIATLIVYSRK
jgi:polysaccharide export outer membrane protein